MAWLPALQVSVLTIFVLLSAPPYADEVVVHVGSLCQLLARGEAPAAPHLAGATLPALPNVQGGVRPIAVGEALRQRLASSCAAPSAAMLARPCGLQLSVGISGGAELIVHSVRRWAHRHARAPHHVILKVDFCNAFNSVSRSSVSQALGKELPGVGPWASWCYGCHSRLLFAKEVITSECGPLRPLFFPLALQPLLRAAATDAKLCVGYLDDVVLAGTDVQVFRALRSLQCRAQASGLELEPCRCELVLGGGPDSSVDRALFPAGVVVNASGNFDLLGAPVGRLAFCQQYTMTERVDKAQTCPQALSDLPDTQTALLLLRHCASFAKVGHAMRLTWPAAHAPALEAFDA